LPVALAALLAALRPSGGGGVLRRFLPWGSWGVLGAVLVALRPLAGGPEHPRAALIVQAVGAYLAGRGAAGRRGRAPAGRKWACPSTGIAPANGERISARQDKCFMAWTY
ncbi:MAG: hypothetical protein IMZ44_16980, partial [Planctomycetes bacterium]|nr:hypothetical protein [Planctomycetota bacterium]